MHLHRHHRLTPLFQRQNLAAAPGSDAGASHDMLFLSTRPDLTPEFPEGLAHPSQRPSGSGSGVPPLQKRDNP